VEKHEDRMVQRTGVALAEIKDSSWENLSEKINHVKSLSENTSTSR